MPPEQSSEQQSNPVRQAELPSPHVTKPAAHWPPRQVSEQQSNPVAQGDAAGSQIDQAKHVPPWQLFEQHCASAAQGIP